MHIASSPILLWKDPAWVMAVLFADPDIELLIVRFYQLKIG
jgi:hypothetical protein